MNKRRHNDNDNQKKLNLVVDLTILFAIGFIIWSLTRGILHGCS